MKPFVFAALIVAVLLAGFAVPPLELALVGPAYTVTVTLPSTTTPTFTPTITYAPTLSPTLDAIQSLIAQQYFLVFM
jgi:hypothetical protein